ncbi:MAG: CPBP family intramembrane metalloprotease, partial [Anaerolineae bacterium]|nr:CPBP family intramembrane metalloprotease [Anaerolineae bacterium]
VVVAAALFGLWHVAWRPLALASWYHGMWTFFAGVVFGYVRERSGGIAAASILHSVTNYIPFF